MCAIFALIGFLYRIRGLDASALSLHSRVLYETMLNAASERRGNISDGFKDFNLKVRARIWP